MVGLAMPADTLWPTVIGALAGRDQIPNTGEKSFPSLTNAKQALVFLLYPKGVRPRSSVQARNLTSATSSGRTQLARASASSFRAFVNKLEIDAERGEADEAPIVEEGTEGVRLMTVHKAKGLQFPVGILADPACSAARDAPSRRVDAVRRLWVEPLCG
jgi:hypothetical protein